MARPLLYGIRTRRRGPEEGEMNERTHGQARLTSRGDRAGRHLRPVDGFVVGGATAWENGQNLWLLLSRPGERLIDFFLEDDEDERAPDPQPHACSGVLPDGKVLIGQVDWEFDRFLSEMLDEEESLGRE